MHTRTYTYIRACTHTHTHTHTHTGDRYDPEPRRSRGNAPQASSTSDEELTTKEPAAKVFEEEKVSAAPYKDMISTEEESETIGYVSCDTAHRADVWCTTNIWLLVWCREIGWAQNGTYKSGGMSKA